MKSQSCLYTIRAVAETCSSVTPNLSSDPQSPRKILHFGGLKIFVAPIVAKLQRQTQTVQLCSKIIRNQQQDLRRDWRKFSKVNNTSSFESKFEQNMIDRIFEK